MNAFFSWNMAHKRGSYQKKDSLSQALTLKVLVLSLIALSGIIGILVSNLIGSLRQVHRDLERTNGLAVERLELFFTDLESSFRTGRHIIQSQDKTRLFLLSLLSKHHYISSIQLMGKDGGIIASETPFGSSPVADHYSFLPHLSTLEFEDFYIGDVVYEQGNSYVYTGVPISNELGLTERFLLAKIDLTDLWLKALEIRVPAKGYVYIQDQDGSLITYPNRQYIGTPRGQGQASSAFDQTVHSEQTSNSEQTADDDGMFFGLTGKRIAVVRSLDNKLVLHSTQSLRTVPWLVVVEQPLFQVLKPIVLVMLGLVPVILIVLYLLYDILKFTRLRLILPLTALRKVVEDSLKNKAKDDPTDTDPQSNNIRDLLSEFPSSSEDELTKFANVHLELQDAKLAVEQLNTELEKRVLERTAQLELEVKERQQAQEELLHLALHDPLTGLPNRMWLTERLTQELERSKKVPDYQFALLFLDGDRFKLINDSLGHSVGDLLLRAVAERLRQSLPSKCHIARLGGDEFTVLVESVTSVEQVKGVAQLLLDTLVEPFPLAQQRLFFGVSIGISISDRSYDEPAQLLRDADIAMYEAKATRQGEYQIFDGAMRQRTIERMQLETELQQAIARDQLYLNYQPIVDLASGTLAGFEALVRWHHHDKGFISPVQFIPIAEETGLVASIDLWVLQQACQQMVQWQKQFGEIQFSSSPHTLPFKMGVNLSAKQFAQPTLIDRIDQVLIETGISPNLLKLEITETALLDSPETAQMLLAEIQSRQIQLAIDDFGIGYSSLSYLHQFPVHTLKIDQSFVRKMEQDASIEPIIRAMIDLAHNLDMVVIAEGIEDDFQRLKLQDFGCDLGQGYLFAKPLDARKATKLIQSQTPLF